VTEQLRQDPEVVTDIVTRPHFKCIGGPLDGWLVDARPPLGIIPGLVLPEHDDTPEDKDPPFHYPHVHVGIDSDGEVTGHEGLIVASWNPCEISHLVELGFYEAHGEVADATAELRWVEPSEDDDDAEPWRGHHP